MDKNKYYPEIYAKKCHYANKLIKLFQNTDFEDINAERELISFLISQNVDYRFEIGRARSYVLMYQNGRNIIDVSSYLCKMLEQTEVDNVRLNDIILPYNSVYFHFGKVLGISLDYLNDAFLTGVFVNKRYRSFNIVLCFSDLEHTNFEFSLAFPFINDNNEETVSNSVFAFDNSEDMIFEFSKVKEAFSKTIYSDIIDDLKMIYKSICLILNCICYLNSTEKDVKTTTTSEQANILIHQLENTSKSQQSTKITQKLSKLSYSKIHLLGHNLQKEYERLNTGREIEPHWRRGHWRNQPYSKGLSETKLIWIKPTIVRKDKGSPDKGHIYELKK